MAAAAVPLAVVAAGASIYGALKQKVPKAPAAPVIAPPPTLERPDSLESQMRRKRAKAQITGASGRKSTLLTGPSGLDLAPTQRKTLLGS